MQRIVEPELMNEAEQAKAYAEADFSEPHNNFVTLFREKFNLSSLSGQVLDLGCGPADISIRFARAFPDVHIVGIDGAEQMLSIGRADIARASLNQRITLHEHYLPCEQLPCDRVETVISNSLLHHLHHPEVMWQTIKQVAQPGTRVFVMDLMRPDSVEIAKQMQRTYAADEPLVLQQDFYNSLLAAFTPAEVKEQLALADLSHLSVEEVSDRHLIVFGQL